MTKRNKAYTRTYDYEDPRLDWLFDGATAGRSPKDDFSIYFITAMVISLCTMALFFEDLVLNYIGLYIFSLAFHILFSLTTLIIMARRYHDLNKSSGWSLLFFCLGFIPYLGAIITIINGIVLSCLDGTPGPNYYGPCPKNRDRVKSKPNTLSPRVIKFNLQRLEKLYAKKVITKAKYEEKKEALLAKLNTTQAQYAAIQAKITSKKNPTNKAQKNVEARLVELKSLYEKGLITEDEYQSQRKQILTEI